MNLAIFDVDGTLLDNMDSEEACYTEALRTGLGLTALHQHIALTVRAFESDLQASADAWSG